VGVAAFCAGRPALSYVGFWALILWVPIAFHGRGVRTYLLLLLLALFSLPRSPLAIFTPMLQAGTVFATKLGLSCLGIEFESNGTLIAVHGFSSGIAAECSGLRSIHLATALSLLVAALYPMRWLGVVVLIAAAAGLAAVGNLIRIFLVIGCGVWRGSEFAKSVGHELVGPAFGIILLLAFFYFSPGVLVRLFPQKAGTCLENPTPGSVSKQVAAALLLLAAGALICSLTNGVTRTAETVSYSPPLLKTFTASEDSR
jgi:exosortase